VPISLDTAALISSLSTGRYTVTRTPAPSYAGGIAVPGTPSTFEISAAVYQASGRDIERLPEGRRSTATKKLFTTTPLRVGAQSGQGGAESGVASDRVLIDGVQHEVQTVGRHPGTTDFYVALLQAVG